MQKRALKFPSSLEMRGKKMYLLYPPSSTSIGDGVPVVGSVESARTSALVLAFPFCDGWCQKRLDNSVRRSSLQISAGNDAAEDEGN